MVVITHQCYNPSIDILYLSYLRWDRTNTANNQYLATMVHASSS